MIITISGKASSGKTTVAKMIAKKLGYKHYSMGDMQRELAKERNMTIEEWGEFEKKDKKFDLMVDERMDKIGKEEDNFVIDAWLAPNFIPNAFKIFLDIKIDEAVKRRLAHKRPEEEFSTSEETKRSIVARAKTNRIRWKEFYDYDFLDMKNYDFVLDTTNLSIDRVIMAIIDKIHEKYGKL